MLHFSTKLLTEYKLKSVLELDLRLGCIIVASLYDPSYCSLDSSKSLPVFVPGKSFKSQYRTKQRLSNLTSGLWESRLVIIVVGYDK